MKQKIKAFLIPMLILMLAVLAAGCAADPTAYEKYDQEGYTVSVRFDANGGTFTTNTSIIVDAYNLEELPVDQNGNAQIALLAPDAENRKDSFSATKSGCFLAGWYATRTQSGEGYIYSDPWNFDSDILTVSAEGEYSSQEPVLTLYAVWVPMFEVEFYSLSDGALVGTYTYNPTEISELTVPAWNQETGTIDMYRFPSLSGYTYVGAYYDAEGTQPITGESITHCGSVNYANGTAENAVMKLYVDYTEGEWYRIYTAEQFADNASVSGCYEICADLDFTDEIWPTSFVYNNFSGKINGNGYTISNITVSQTQNSKVNAGLFGYLTEQAQITDLTFSNVSFTIQSGTRVAGTNYGLFAGTVSDSAVITDVSVLDSVLYIDSGCYFGVDDYTIGLVCGMGNAQVLTEAEITCEAAGSAPETVHIIVDDGQVTVEFD